MQSSLGVFMRALVMLGCLIALPLLAICGKIPIPRELTRLLSEAAFGALLAPGSQAAAAEASPDGGELSIRKPAVGTAQPGAVGSETQALPQPDVPVRYEDQWGSAAPAADMFSTSGGHLGGADGGTVASPDRMQLLLGRLRDLGMRQHALESWGEAGELYRFKARVIIGEHADLERHVESVAADPLAAMADVVQQIVAWQNWPSR